MWVVPLRRKINEKLNLKSLTYGNVKSIWHEAFQLL